MDFLSVGRPVTSSGLNTACASIGVGAVELWSVLTVETHGFGFLSDRRPAILFERHKFSAFTNGRFDATYPALSNPVQGGYTGGAGEYPRLQTAMTLDQDAALRSASWGVGQVMGFNFHTAGFATVDEMVTAMVVDEDTQLAAAATFLRGSGLHAPLQHHDWATFARGYNGKNFAINKYDQQLAAAFARCSAMMPDLSFRAAQAALLYLGFNPGPVDGRPGRFTSGALAAFQARHGLPATGELDQVTETSLTAAAFPS